MSPSKRSKRAISNLKEIHAGRAAAVLGGGPSLPADFEALRQADLDPVLLAVNHHAQMIGIQADYMVYNDHPDGDQRAEMERAIRSFTGVKISPEATSDVMFDVPVWTGFLSSNTATWLALYMGCDPVVLCGMDCYQGAEVYCHPTAADCPAFHYPLDHYMRPWREEGVHKLPNIDRVQVMSGPLGQIFPYFKR